jgi:predicted site-specific integrase-resolvase
MTDQQFEDVITEPQAASRLDVSRRTLQRWRSRDGDLAPPHYQLPSGTVRYPVDALEKWVEAHRRGAEQTEGGGQ